jgi:hypothetical protein
VRFRQQCLARSRQFHARRAALEQFEIQRFLERFQMPADRRLRNVQQQRGFGQVAVLGHRDERADLVNFHGQRRARATGRQSNIRARVPANTSQEAGAIACGSALFRKRTR